jgi:hypothetical protein
VYNRIAFGLFARARKVSKYEVIHTPVPVGFAKKVSVRYRNKHFFEREKKMRECICSIFAFAVLLAGCAGREANPIPIYLPGDENRSCPALKAEIAQLQVDMARLLPKTDKGLTNVLWGAGGVIFLPLFFFIDLKGAEKIEFDAMRQRHNRLLVYAAEKGCDMSGVRAERIQSVEERKADAKKTKEDSEDTQETKR